MRLIYKNNPHAINPRWRSHKRWYLNGAALRDRHVTILFALMGAPSVKMYDLIEMIWPDPDCQPDYYEECIRQAIMRVRRKLIPYGWTISGGQGLCRNDPRAGFRLERIAQDEPMRMAA